MSQSLHLPVLQPSPSPEPPSGPAPSPRGRPRRSLDAGDRGVAAALPLPELLLPELLGDLQSHGVRWVDERGPGLSRVGGAGPSDHKAVSLGGVTVMVPIHTVAAARSPYHAEVAADGGSARVHRGGRYLATVTFPRQPRFYGGSTRDGVPYWKLATLHAGDVLASTVLQNCTRYGDRRTSCQFCAIGQSLQARSTIPRKTPAQLAEVAEAAVRLDAVQHMVLTTGTPPTPDRGAAILEESVRAIVQAVPLPVQVQCEPPEDFGWFARLRAAGAASLGLHLEAVTEEVRQRIMPGKAEVPVSRYLEAFAAAVEVFGRGQVSTYVLAGLGDSHDAIVAMARRCAELGVYPFVVPFVPIAGTPLAGRAPPDASFMSRLLDDVAAVLAGAGLRSDAIEAGCGRCGACSTLKAREVASAGASGQREVA